MGNDSMNNHKVAVIYPYVAHYRKPVFDALCRDSDIDYYIVSDQESNMESLPVLNGSLESSGQAISSRWITIKNHWLTDDILWQRGVVRIALSKEFRALILLGNMYYLSNWVAMALARLTGKKVYLWTHGVRKREAGLKKVLRMIFYRLSDGLMLYGHRAASILAEAGMPSEKMHVIYNSLDFDAQNEVLDSISDEKRLEKRRQLGIDVSEKVVIAIGRLTKDKKFGLLLDAMEIISRSEPVVPKLLIVGDGPEYESLKSRISEKRLGGQVILYGACYDERETALLISLSSVSVVPGDIGLSAIHSLTYGTPVVTHDNLDTHKPEFEAVKDEVNGSFYRHDDVKDLSEKIRFWLNGSREQTFKSCRAVVQEFYNPRYQAKKIREIVLGEAAG